MSEPEIPKPVKRPVFDAFSHAFFDLWKAWFWGWGLTDNSSFAIIHGRVLRMWEAKALVQHRRGFATVEWLAGIAPPLVRPGVTISVVGNLHSYNAGRRVVITSCRLIRPDWRQRYKKAQLALLESACYSVQEYVSAEQFKEMENLYGEPSAELRAYSLARRKGRQGADVGDCGMGESDRERGK